HHDGSDTDARNCSGQFADVWGKADGRRWWRIFTRRPDATWISLFDYCSDQFKRAFDHGHQHQPGDLLSANDPDPRRRELSFRDYTEWSRWTDKLSREHRLS